MNPLPNPDDSATEYEKLFPIFFFVLRRPFECLALLISLAGILGYAAGASFHEGWSKAAGIPSAMFQLGPYETIIKGLSLKKTWLYLALSLLGVSAYISILHLSDEVQVKGEFLVRNRRKKFEKRSERLIRHKIVSAARQERKILGSTGRSGGACNVEWRALASRGKWLKLAEARKIRLRKNRRIGARLLSLVLQVVLMGLACIAYVVLNAVIVKGAEVEGVRNYIGLYAAVTGKSPQRNKLDTVPPDKLLEFACQGADELWKYTVIATDSKNKDNVRYVLRANEKHFLLLGAAGMSLNSFGDGIYELKEESLGPRADLIKKCSSK